MGIAVAGEAEPDEAGTSRFVRWFIPASYAGTEEFHRVRLAVVTAWVMVGAFAALAAIHARAASAIEVVFPLGLAIAIATGPFALRWGARYSRVLNAVLAACFVGSVSLVAVRGPGVTPATVAIAEVPMFATLLGGIRVGMVWAIVCALAEIGVGFAGAEGWIAPAGAARATAFSDLAALLVVVGTLFLVAALYEDIRRRSVRRISALDARRLASERERIEALLEARTTHADRLASLGRIAAATAHEINNPLSYVANNIEFVQRALGGLAANPETAQALIEAQEGVARIGRIVDDLKGGTRPEDDVIGPVDLIKSLRTAMKMAVAHTRPRARVLAQFADMRYVVGNDGRLVQVFLNLMVNAAEGIPEGNASEHQISVRTRADGDRVVIEVEDSGVGTPTDVHERAKDSLFTTRVGEGVGLGLALCHGILDSIGGTLQFDSGPGKTVATVRLTAAEGSSRPERATPIAAASVADGRIFQILVIDDEPLVARAVARGLRPHNVTVAANGRIGLGLIAEGQAYDLILCDLMMPEVTGMDVYEELVRLHPTALAKLAFISGGTFTERAREFMIEVNIPLIDKPIDFAQIRALLPSAS